MRCAMTGAMRGAMTGPRALAARANATFVGALPPHPQSIFAKMKQRAAQ
jgi:hypothetical protein